MGRRNYSPKAKLIVRRVAWIVFGIGGLLFIGGIIYMMIQA